MRRFLLRVTPLFIFVLFTSIPFTKVSAYSVLFDEYGRMVWVTADGEVLGEQSGPSSGSPMGGDQQSEYRLQQQNNQQPQSGQQFQQQTQKKAPDMRVQPIIPIPQEQQGQQPQPRPSMSAQPTGSVGQEMQKKPPDMRVQPVFPTQQQQRIGSETDRMRIGVQNGEMRVQSPQSGASGGFGQTERHVDSVKVRESAQKHEVEIKANGNELELDQNNVRAKTRFPISVNDKNELIVTTPNGTQTVTVLPEEAVKEAFRRGAMTSFGGAGQTGAAGVNGKQEVELTQENGKLEYKVEGVKEAKLFGFFPVSSQVETHVSAETGSVTSVSQPWFFSNFGFLFR